MSTIAGIDKLKKYAKNVNEAAAPVIYCTVEQDGDAAYLIPHASRVDAANGDADDGLVLTYKLMKVEELEVEETVVVKDRK